MFVRRALLTLTLAGLCVGAIAAPAAAATPGEITSVEVPGVCIPPWLGAAPGEGVVFRLCPKSDPEPEFDELFLGSTLVRVVPDGGTEEIAVPQAAAGPIVAGPRGEVWIGANGPEYGATRAASIQRVDPGGAVTSYPVVGASKNGRPAVLGLALGAEGATWAAIGEGAPNDAALGGSVGGELVRIDPGGAVARFPIPGEIEPQAIALGPDGNLWFTAIRGRSRAEHVFRPGVGFIGLMTPAGVLNLFQVPHRRSDPTAIAAAPDGTLWFAESEGSAIGTIRTDGRFGHRHKLWWGADTIAFGPEGDAWIGWGYGLVRMTQSGQQTLFPAPSPQVAVGAEGDIWGLDEGHLHRVVPGAPGIDVRALSVVPGGQAIRLRLACGGSASGCEGTFDLSMPTIRFRGKRVAKRNVWPGLRIAHLTYGVAAESSRTLTIKLPAGVIALAARRDAHGLTEKIRAEATVAGGPGLTRTLYAQKLAQAGSAASAAK